MHPLPERYLHILSVHSCALPPSGNDPTSSLFLSDAMRNAGSCSIAYTNILSSSSALLSHTSRLKPILNSSHGLEKSSNLHLPSSQDPIRSGSLSFLYLLSGSLRTLFQIYSLPPLPMHKQKHTESETVLRLIRNTSEMILSRPSLLRNDLHPHQSSQ